MWSRSLLGEAGEPGISDAPTWSSALLLIFLVGATELFFLFVEVMERFFHYQAEPALVKLIRHVKKEVLFVGFVSLFLAVFEAPLSTICYKVSINAAFRSKSSGSSRLLLSANPPPPTHDAPPPPTGDYLSAAYSSSSYFDYGVECDHGAVKAKCPEGQAQLWTKTLQHEVHLLLFSMAVAHILVSTLSLLVSRRIVGVWRSWEVKTEKSTEENIVQASSSPLSILWLSLFGVTNRVYSDIRRLFIVDMPLSHTLNLNRELETANFNRILVWVMNEGLADIADTAWWLWLVPVIILIIPLSTDILAISIGISGGALVFATVVTAIYLHKIQACVPRRVELAREPQAVVSLANEPGLFASVPLGNSRSGKTAVVPWNSGDQSLSCGADARFLKSKIMHKLVLGIQHSSDKEHEEEEEEEEIFEHAISAPPGLNFFQKMGWWARKLLFEEQEESFLKKAISMFASKKPPLAHTTDRGFLVSPQTILLIIKVVIFQATMNIAFCSLALFQMYKAKKLETLAVSSKRQAIIFMCIDVGMIAWMSLVPLPLLSLSLPLSDQCSNSIIKRAMETVRGFERLETKAMRKMQTMAKDGEGKKEEEEGKTDIVSLQEGHDHNKGSEV